MWIRKGSVSGRRLLDFTHAKAATADGVKSKAIRRPAKTVRKGHSVPRNLAKPTFVRVQNVLRSLSEDPPSVYKHATNRSNSSVDFQFYSFKAFSLGRFK